MHVDLLISPHSVNDRSMEEICDDSGWGLEMIWDRRTILVAIHSLVLPIQNQQNPPTCTVLSINQYAYNITGAVEVESGRPALAGCIFTVSHCGLTPLQNFNVDTYYTVPDMWNFSLVHVYLRVKIQRSPPYPQNSVGLGRAWYFLFLFSLGICNMCEVTYFPCLSMMDRGDIGRRSLASIVPQW